MILFWTFLWGFRRGFGQTVDRKDRQVAQSKEDQQQNWMENGETIRYNTEDPLSNLGSVIENGFKMIGLRKYSVVWQQTILIFKNKEAAGNEYKRSVLYTLDG